MKNNSSLVLKVVGFIFLSFLVCCGDRLLADDVIAVLPQDGDAPRRVALQSEGVLLTKQVPPWPVGSFVMLRGGGVVAGELAVLTAKEVQIETVSFGWLAISRDEIVGYRKSIGIGPRRHGVRNGLTSTVSLSNGDWLNGSLVTVADGDVRIQMNDQDSSDQSLAVSLDRVLAIDLIDSTKNLSIARGKSVEDSAWIAFEDGSRFLVKKNGQGNWLQPFSVTETKVNIVPVFYQDEDGVICFRDEIAVLEPLAQSEVLAQSGLVSRVFALEDDQEAGQLQPLPIEDALSFGETYTGEWPRLRGLTGLTALGLHSPYGAKFRFDQPAARFLAVVGVDDTAGEGGSVVVSLHCNVQKELAGETFSARGQRSIVPRGSSMNECFRSPILRGGDAPFVIDVSLEGSTRLQLRAESADGESVLDRLLLLDPRVIYFP